MCLRWTHAGTRFLDNVLPAIIQIGAAIQYAEGSAWRVEDRRGTFDGVGLQIRDGRRWEHLRAIPPALLGAGSLPLRRGQSHTDHRGGAADRNRMAMNLQ